MRLTVLRAVALALVARLLPASKAPTQPAGK